MTAKEKTLDEAILDLNRILDESGIKSARKLTILRIADAYADIKTLHIAEQAINEARDRLPHRSVENGSLRRILTRIKTLIEE